MFVHMCVCPDYMCICACVCMCMCVSICAQVCVFAVGCFVVMCECVCAFVCVRECMLYERGGHGGKQVHRSVVSYGVGTSAHAKSTDGHLC